MIHIRGLWVANGSTRAARAERRARLEEEKRKRRAELILDTYGEAAWPFPYTKRAARLILSQQYRQQGGN